MGKAKDFSSYISDESKSRQPSPMKAFALYLTIPDLISLGGGSVLKLMFVKSIADVKFSLPDPGYFPFKWVDVRVPTLGNFEENTVISEGSTIRVPKDSDPRTFPSSDTPTVSKTYPTDLSKTLQYGQGYGDNQLREFAREHIKMVHAPPYEDWEVMLSIGNTLAFEACIRTFLSRGDSIIMEDYTYTSAVYSCRPQRINIVGIPMDGEGMRPDLLDEKLSSWKPSQGRKPKVAYIVPTGQNPSGSSMFHERRKQLYAIFQKHDILIIEDDPYYFLQMEPYSGETNPSYKTLTTSQEFLSGLIPSFLSMDIDGRVVRLDSLSKVLAPGIRLGFITASTQISERLLRCIEVTSQAPSGFSQSIAYQLLAQHWGHDGFYQWLIYIRSEYTKRRDVCCRAMDKFLPKQAVEYIVPTAGMFFWIQVTGKIDGMNGVALQEKLFQKCLDKKVLVLPGSVFKADESDSDDQVYFRGTFAAVPLDKLEVGIQRLGNAIKDVFGLDNRP